MGASAGFVDFCAALGVNGQAALAEQQLARLAAREEIVRAFVCYDAAAASRDVAAAAPGPLSGALIGVKDIITTAQFPTLYGSSTRQDSGPRVDAWSVARARRLGGVILGKTVCTEFAIPIPGPTTNPSDPRRTPGGSSSGSAAAVAAGFVSFAIGTQTAGSTIRPASFCGITGYKPTYGLLHTAGVGAISTTLDHLGIFARSPRDAWYFVSALVLAQPDLVAPRRPRRLLMLRPPPDVPQTDGYPERLARLASDLDDDDIEIETIDFPFPADDFRNLQKRICYWEAARLLVAPGDVRPGPELASLLGPYLDGDIDEYVRARRLQCAYQAQFQALAASYDAVLMPAACGAAPLSLADTGDAVMNRFWTALHSPVLSVPLWTTEDGAPLGLQLIGKLGADRTLCSIAQWFIEKMHSG